MDTQHFYPKQFQWHRDFKKETFLWEKRKVTLKWLNGSGDNIYFQSITVFLLVSCHLFWMSRWTPHSFMFSFHSCHIIEPKKIIESDILRIQSELFRINIILKARHFALDILFRKIIPDMGWLFVSENMDTEEKNTSPPTSAVEFGWKLNALEMEDTQGRFSQQILPLGGALIIPSCYQLLFTP